jgi:hypothetical protein
LESPPNLSSAASGGRGGSWAQKGAPSSPEIETEILGHHSAVVPRERREGKETVVAVEEIAGTHVYAAQQNLAPCLID